jgi:hypothetical protein
LASRVQGKTEVSRYDAPLTSPGAVLLHSQAMQQCGRQRNKSKGPSECVLSREAVEDVGPSIWGYEMYKYCLPSGVACSLSDGHGRVSQSGSLGLASGNYKLLGLSALPLWE